MKGRKSPIISFLVRCKVPCGVPAARILEGGEVFEHFAS